MAKDFPGKFEKELSVAFAMRAGSWSLLDCDTGQLGIAIRHAPVARLVLSLCAHDRSAGLAGGLHRRIGVYPRWTSDRGKNRPGHALGNGATGAPQHATLRRVHHSCGHRVDLHWGAGNTAESVFRKGD